MLSAATRWSAGHRGRGNGYDVTGYCLSRSGSRIPGDFAAGFHGSRYLLHERAAAVHLYQGAAFHSLENADFLFVLVYFGFFIRIS